MGIYFFLCLSMSKRSSPIIFTTSGRKVNQKEGQLIVFDSRLKHRVPHNQLKGNVFLLETLFLIGEI